MNDIETYTEDYSRQQPMSETRRLSERYALPRIDMNEIENAIRARDASFPDMGEVLQSRNAVHGDFTDDAALSQALKDVMHVGRNWPVLNPVQREALEQIATKIGRILSGDPNFPDHWRDLQGYPKLVEERL
jgi:hypothetical protein